MIPPLQIHRLSGCAPRPLAHYLKALGVLRLVGSQTDRSARGWWSGDTFLLGTSLSRDALLRFFLEEYEPTPMLAPWNGGSGFYRKDKKDGIDAIRASTTPRLAAYRAAIETAEALSKAYEEAPKREEKAALLRRLRSVWRGSALTWLDVATVIADDGLPTYPALLGTGGNDGRLDFTNNFMQRIAELFDLQSSEAPARTGASDLLEGALWQEPVPGLESCAIGQFLPGGAGGANSTNGFSGDPVVNPWDFVLMLEGTLLFVCSLVRRSEPGAAAHAAAPFAMRSVAAGYGTAARADESARGEQWMPIWERPARVEEIQDLLLEGRSRLGRRACTGALDFARSVSRLGVARGIQAFERYAYIERNGQANLATPLGRWIVSPKPHQDLVDEVAPWVNALHAIANDGNAPASFERAARRCEEALMACCHERPITTTWQRLLRELARAERLAVLSPRFAADKGMQPLPRLGHRWVEMADDGGPEIQLAAAMAGAHLDGERPGEAWASARIYWLPLDETGRRPRFPTGPRGIEVGVRQVGRGVDLTRDLIAVLRRRAIERAHAGDGTLGLGSVAGLADEASLADFLHGSMDDSLCLDLTMALMAVDWRGVKSRIAPTRRATIRQTHPGPLQGLFRLALPLGPLPHAAGAELGLDRVHCDVGVLELLAAGRMAPAAQVALRRARADGARPKLRLAAGGPGLARRMAASLAFPLTGPLLLSLLRSTLKPELTASSQSVSLPS